MNQQIKKPFCIEDAKEDLAEIFFQCARYERNSTDWNQALDEFCTRVISAERNANAELCESLVSKESASWLVAKGFADSIRNRTT